MTALSLRLREATQHSHTAAENTAFMKCMLKGIVEWQSFRKLIANLYFIYSSLETELQRHIAHPVVGLIYFPELNRQEHLQQDLSFYYGQNWRNIIAPSTAAQIYVDRIQFVSRTEPALLVAHSYTRYMGDLSGGQGLKNVVRAALQLPANLGTALYEFDQMATVPAQRAFKERYRQALDSLPVDEETAQRIAVEANDAFALNRAVLNELAGDIKALLGESVFDLITRYDQPGSTERSPSATTALG
jgi:heme oxygenase (biliverdin-producing, ferredoxin)